jgi:hypothetical protein
MNKTTATVTYKALSNALNNRPVTSFEFELPYLYFITENAPNFQLSQDKKWCEEIFSNTNNYSGSLWSVIEPLLPANRTHTALSVGDEITISNLYSSRTYRCDDFGWELLVKTQKWELVNGELQFVDSTIPASQLPIPINEGK